MDKKLGQLVIRALDEGLSERLVVVILTTTYRPRLDAMLAKASRDCLQAFAIYKGCPLPPARQQLEACKLLVDLIRLRRSWLGARRPDAQTCLDLFAPVRTSFGRLRKAA